MELRDFIDAAAREGNLLDELVNQTVSDEQRAEIASAKTLKDKIIAVLKTVKDPELPLNIWELGLIYDLEISDNGKVVVNMTLTAPACPVAGAMPVEVEKRIRTLAPEVKDVSVNLVWEPRWNREMMSEEARLMLDLW